MQQRRLISSSLVGIRNGFGLQLLTKVLTFTLNWLMFGYLGAKIIGIAYVQLHLVLTVILFVSREGVRRAAQRSKDFQPGAVKKQAIPSLINISWLSVLCSVVLAVIVDHVAVYWIPVDTSAVSQAEFQTHVRWFCVAAILEMLSEPAFVLLFGLQISGVRLRVESTAVFLKCVLTAVLAMQFGLELHAFSYGQVVFSLVLLIGYYGDFYRNLTTPNSVISSMSELFPSLRVPARVLRDDAGRMTFQSLLKFGLTEGEKLVLVRVTESSDQGVYASVHNLGSTIARILFMPVEEHAAHLFSNLLRPTDTAAPTPAARKTAANVLQVLVKLMLLIGLLAMAFGPSYSDFVVRYLMRGDWIHTEAPTVLAAFCGYIALIALNGVTEAFSSAVAKPSDHKVQSAMMVVVTVLFIPVSVLCTSRWQSLGLVLANSFSMLL
eukprot:TRINITY_DN2627_c0_g1_i3.p1 TRINITY_DN2627_c0_g1~~TRINITY_DN2627_c0_g1_i3.p1  ORF type:complete len:436 (-),score=88.57 TRINITY_DN2627_c0_g1_i3:215-1522(-)